MTLQIARPAEELEAVSGAEGLVPVALGIEIGGTKLQSAVVAADGRVLLRRSDRVDPAGGAGGIRTVLAAQIAGIIDDAAGKGLAIRAIGIGFGGPVNREQGVETTRFRIPHPLAVWLRWIERILICASRNTAVTLSRCPSLFSRKIET